MDATLVARFYTPPQIIRQDVSLDACIATASERGIRPLDILALSDGTLFEVDRANGFVITGYTIDRRRVGVDLRNAKATVVSQATLFVQDELLKE